MKKLAVFDWNGTLLADTVQSWKAGNVCLEFYGGKAISLAQYRETFTFPIIHFYKKNGLEVDHVLKHKDAANTVFQAEYERLSATARTRTGTRSLLEWLRVRDVDCMILSNYRTQKIAAHCRRLGIDHYFKDISAYDCDGSTIMHSATKNERLSAYMKQRGFRPQDTVIIGDSTEEPDIARHLALSSIGILDGYITPARLRAARPDHVIRSLSKIPAILHQKWGLRP
jgi:phosphoglycolate phosphatase